jgi:hypothetical protein
VRESWLRNKNSRAASLLRAHSAAIENKGTPSRASRRDLAIVVSLFAMKNSNSATEMTLVDVPASNSVLVCLT